ncbi:hypothetical protein BC941DRAFT_425664 [Chlamydoabsidia padenii]|nr:hypothetical protein BC941DRAFT_425664 [Chlamydoabsidia padenii]
MPKAESVCKTFERSLKKRLGPNYRLDENVERLIYLNFVMFVKRLAKASHEEVSKRQPSGKKNLKVRIDTADIRNVSEGVLRKFRG